MATKTYVENRFKEFEGARGTYSRIYPENLPVNEISHNKTTYGWEREISIVLPKEGEFEFSVHGDFNGVRNRNYIADSKGVYFIDDAN